MGFKVSTDLTWAGTEQEQTYGSLMEACKALVAGVHRAMKEGNGIALQVLEQCFYIETNGLMLSFNEVKDICHDKGWINDKGEWLPDFHESWGMKPAEDTGGYHVALKTIVGSHRGVVTRTMFGTKEAFEEWYLGNMADGTPVMNTYEVVSEGSEAEAARAVETPQNAMARIEAAQREIAEDPNMPPILAQMKMTNALMAALL